MIVLPLSYPDVVAPGETICVSRHVQVSFRGERLFVSPAIARFFAIDVPIVGNDAGASVCKGMVPADAFSSIRTTGAQLCLEPAPIGIAITIHAKNVGRKPHRFASLIFGTRYDGPSGRLPWGPR